MYDYHGTAIHHERLAKGLDHCASRGMVVDLATLIRNGVIYDPSHPQRALSSDSGPGEGRRFFIYAVGLQSSVHIGIDGNRGAPDAVKHETLFHNLPVLAAGEIMFSDGMIVRVNDQSGSYSTFGKIRTDTRFLPALFNALDVIDAPLDPLERARLSTMSGRL